jgi:hypothetical protein
MDPDDSTVEHQLLVVRIAGERVEDLFPNPGFAQARETLLDRLPFALLRQMLPVRARPQNPKNTFYEQSVIDSCPAKIAELAGKHRCNPLSLCVREFVPLDHLRGS